ncbi:MAG: S8 family peptidase, partial [Ignavibacteriales bacterium]|nr:S8 family peptidase [Ignavibacteriales bacterium]
IIAGFEGVVYAADMGARVINCSWGGSGASQTEQDFVNYATGKGALVVAAAGNGNVTTPSYPASYANVISVAATKQTDAKASYSSFGPTVDVSAPGGEPFNTPTVAIYSTDYDSTYGNSAGTSEATPFVSGLAALVASYFPGYSALQVGDQVRVTCDDINGVNPSYVNQLGKGRINAVRALTDSLPSLRMLSTVIKDSVGGNNNGILEPNEDFTITTNFINYLKPTTNAMVTLSTSDTNVQINSNTFAIGALGTMGVTDNSSSPFQVHVKSNPTPGHVVAFTLTISDGTYSDFQIFNVLINPTFATHDVNNVKVTFTNNGRIAFNDFPSNTEGVGFVFPAPSDTNHLFEGGLIIGNSATKLLNVIRNNSGTQDADFSSSQIYNLGTPDSISSPHQHGSTIFTDSLAPSTNKLGLKVYMDSYAFVTAPDNNYVLVRYVMRNTSASTISGLYIGLFFDWDMQPNYATNKTDYDTSRGLGYAWDNGAVNPIYCGARALSGAAGYRGLINSASNPLDLSRTSKWAWLSGGIVTTNVQEDIHFVLSSGPFAIASGATQMVGFAIVGGTDLTNLQANADAAQAKWNKLLPVLGVGEQPMGVPTVYSLSQNYPNPFNPSTHIRYELPKTSVVSLKVFDVLGREVGTLVNGEQTAGRYTVPFDGSRLASGLYFYRLVAGEYTAMKKLMLIK